MKIIEGAIISGVSARHLHLSQEHLEKLFGPGATLTCYKDLRQPGQFACEEKVSIVGPKGTFENVRVLGPVRKETQIEISLTDSLKLGLTPPVRDSGDVEGTPGVELIGPKGRVKLERGLMIAKRHIHMLPEDAEYYGVKDKDLVAVLCDTKGRKAVLMDVLVRVNPNYALEFHVDTDESNAVLLKTGDLVHIVEI
jgi:putative phosphotransacetylase